MIVPVHLEVAATDQVSKTSLNYNVIRTVNVKSFGAKLDGVTNDTVAIKKAINSASKGDIIFFPNGTCLLNQITIDKPLYLYTQGTVLKPISQTPKQAIFYICSSNVKIDGFTFEGGNADCYGVKIAGTIPSDVSNVKVLNCVLKNFGRDGINGIYTKNLFIDGIIGTNLCRNGGNGSVYISESHDISIQNSNIYDSHLKGFATAASDNVVYDNLKVTNMTPNNRRDGQAIGIYVGYENQNIKINNCQSKNNYEAAIKISKNASNVNIDKCQFEGADNQYCVWAAGCYEISFSNCTIKTSKNKGAVCITVHTKSVAHDIKLINCNIQGNGDEYSRVCINEQSFNITLYKNTLTGCGIYAAASSNINLSDNIINRGNNISNIGGITCVKVKNSKIASNNVTQAGRGIYLSECANIEVYKNISFNNSYADIFDIKGANNKIYKNQ